MRSAELALDPSDNPPEGFVRSSERGPFSSHNGPFYHKVAEDKFWHGVRLRERHCNGHGIIHGGFYMTFADGLMGAAVWRATGIGGVTVRMTSDFLGMAKPGDWLEGEAIVTRAAKTVAFAEAKVYVGSRSVLTASGVFKLLPKRMRRDDSQSA